LPGLEFAAISDISKLAALTIVSTFFKAKPS